MSVWSVTLTVALSIALSGVIALSAWAIKDVLDDRRAIQNVRVIALAYRDHMVASRCVLPNTELALSTVRASLSAAGQDHPAVGEEASWRMSFDGDKNRQAAVTLFKIVSGSNITHSDTFVLPMPGGDRTHEFFDAVFDSRVCP